MTYSKTTRQIAEIYTLLCRSGMNKEYYGTKLNQAQVLSQWLDILIAVGTAGGGISALTIWETSSGRVAWATLTAASTFLALAKPIIQINRKIEVFSRLFIGHSDIYTSLIILASRVKRYGELTSEMISSFENVELRFLELSKEDDPRPNYRLLQKCETIIRNRHPPEDAWFPDDDAVKSFEGEPVEVTQAPK